ncbi:MAG: FkbM family methyltransferase [Phycisphaerae bacterium]|nr:FkbM family methyltransferase [Phycisphaerae bacterium]
MDLLWLISVPIGLALGGWAAYRAHRTARRRRREHRITPTAALEEVLRLRRQLRRAQLEAALAREGRQFALPFRFTSETGEDEFLFELFDGQTRGTFAEVGAHDGVTCSVTYPFEAAGWRGVLVEPLPEEFERCRGARPNSRVVNAALGPAGSSGRATFTVVRGETRSGQHSFLGENASRARALARRGKAVERVDVPLTTMDAVLAEHLAAVAAGAAGSLPHLDFAVIDVEGGELGLLQGFDLDRWKPRALLIEDWDRPEDRRVRAYLEGRGYRRCGRQRHNSVYVRADEPALAERAREMARPA